MKFILKFKNSFKELRSIKNLSLIAIFWSVWFILNLSVVEISGLVSISFEFIAILLVGAFFGPFIGAVFGFFGDLLSYLIHPVGGFYFLFAVSVMIDGIIYGLILYKKKFSFKAVILAQIARDVLTNVLLNTLFISMQFGLKFVPLLLYVRIPKNILKIPVNLVVVLVLAKFLKKVNYKLKKL